MSAKPKRVVTVSRYDDDARRFETVKTVVGKFAFARALPTILRVMRDECTVVIDRSDSVELDHDSAFGVLYGNVRPGDQE